MDTNDWFRALPHSQLSYPGDQLDAMIDSEELLSRTKRYVTSQGFVEQSRIVALYIIFIIVIIIINGFLGVVILTSKTMRSSSRHVLIISVCMGDLLMGVFVLPILLNIGLRSDDDDDDDATDCASFHAMRLFADFLLPSVTTLAVLALNIDYILRISCSAYGEGVGRACIMVALFMAPWLISCCAIIPLYLNALPADADRPGLAITNCAQVLDSKLEGDITRSLLIISYFPQAFLLLIFNIVVTTLYLLKRDSFGLDACGERIRAPVDICLASFTTLVLYTPIFLIALLTTQGYLACEGDEECAALRKVYIAAIWCYFAKSWVLPFAWLVCRDTRACIRKLPD